MSAINDYQCKEGTPSNDVWILEKIDAIPWVLYENLRLWIRFFGKDDKIADFIEDETMHAWSEEPKL